MERQAGVLLNVSSLPGKYGIGGFSCNAEYFLNEFAGMGFKISGKNLPPRNIKAEFILQTTGTLTKRKKNCFVSRIREQTTFLKKKSLNLPKKIPIGFTIMRRL